MGCYEERTLTLNDPFVISFGGIISPTCPDGSNGQAILNSSGCQCQFSTCTFLWDNGITTKPNYSLTSGWHEVTINHPNGCIVVDSVLIPEPLPVIMDTIITNNTCFGDSTGSVELISSGIYEPTDYLWSTSDTTALNNNLTAGNYTVSVSDARGCVEILSFGIIEPSEVILSYSIENVSCFGESNGEIDFQATGGTGTYSFWINSTQSGSVAAGLTAGTYLVSAADNAQCFSATQSAVITQPSSISSIISSTPETDGFDGTANVIIQGGVAPYTIVWNDPNSQDASLAVYLTEGWYSASITDANGCQHEDSVYVGSIVGIVDESIQSISVYPNPAKDILTINGIVGSEIQLFDANGKSIKKLPFSNSLSTSELTSGVYYLEINQDKTITRIRFCKVN
jgi:hypothetical protein